MQPLTAVARLIAMTAFCRALIIAVLAFASACLAATLPAASAQASCAGPSGTVSAHPFTGTVIAVGNNERTATVRTDDGRTVTVRGSDAVGPNEATSVDRTYRVGLRYEFHPTNDRDPFLDNACTATHEIGGSPAPAGTGGTASAAVGWLAAATAVVAGVALLWLVRRRRRRSADRHGA